MMIREKLYNMYKDKKHVTVKSLNIELKQHDLNISNSSLNRTLHDIGFKLKKVELIINLDSESSSDESDLE